MLQAFRTHKRWLMFIAMVLIIPSFVVTGIYSYSRMSTDDNAIARVGEVPILPEQFDMAQRQQLQNLQQQLGEAFRPNMLDNAEARAAILQSMMDDSAGFGSRSDRPREERRRPQGKRPVLARTL